MKNIHHHFRSMNDSVYLLVIDHCMDKELSVPIINEVRAHLLLSDDVFSDCLNPNPKVINQNMYDDAVEILIKDGVL